MIEALREQVLATLRDDWAPYPERFHRLSPEAQAAFLTQQGYARLADLLAHVTAWWRDGSRVTGTFLADPDAAMPDYDVDAFNAQAVSGVRDLDEPAVIQAFEDEGRRMLERVTSLPKAAFRDKRIAGRLQMDVIGHYAEHALAG